MSEAVAAWKQVPEASVIIPVRNDATRLAAWAGTLEPGIDFIWQSEQMQRSAQQIAERPSAARSTAEPSLKGGDKRATRDAAPAAPV